MKNEETKELTKEEIENDLKELHDKMQNDFIDKLNESVDWLIEKSMKKSYAPTNYERIVFNEIRTKLNNMNKWF